MRISNYTIGADPELFIVNETTNKVVSSIGIIPGEKGNPWVGEDMPNGYGLETDNIVAEFNIPPTSNRNSFVESIEFMKEYINKFVKKVNPELGILCKASMEVDEDQLQSDQAKLFGCDVDFNAYTESPNPKPKGERTNLRSCGFHIHIGYNNFNIDTSLQLIKYLDMYVGVPSILIDKDNRRRELYGKAGCFRLTPYGCEYRVLSSEMMSSRDNLNFVWKQIERAITAYNQGESLCGSNYIINAINGNDVDLAKRIIASYNIV